MDGMVLLMEGKMAHFFGLSIKKIEELLPILVKYAEIDKKHGPIGFFKLRKVVRNEKKNVEFDEAEWRFYERVRFLYSKIMGLEKEELLLLKKIIEILLETG